MRFPTRAETETVLMRLAEGTLTPIEANDWARSFVTDEATHPPSPLDQAVWTALNQLCGADLETAPGERLHSPEDFAAWLEQFRRDVQTRPE